MEVFVPAPTLHLPPKQRKFLWLNANHKPHWAPRGKIVKAWRRSAEVAAREAGLAPFTGHVHITATCHKPVGGYYDAANLAPTFKSIVDGIVDSGVLVDDDNEHVTGPDPRAGEPRPDAPGVRLVFTPS